MALCTPGRGWDGQSVLALEPRGLHPGPSSVPVLWGTLDKGSPVPSSVNELNPSAFMKDSNRRTQAKGLMNWKCHINAHYCFLASKFTGSWESPGASHPTDLHQAFVSFTKVMMQAHCGAGSCHTRAHGHSQQKAAATRAHTHRHAGTCVCTHSHSCTHMLAINMN